jgi:hypothetical protein
MSEFECRVLAGILAYNEVRNQSSAYYTGKTATVYQIILERLLRRRQCI